MFDVAPTILEAAGVKIPHDFEAKSLVGSLYQRADHQPREAVYSELSRDHIQTGAEFIMMRRDDKWKIVLYLDDTYGELYDLKADPHEKKNLWTDDSLAETRERLRADSLLWLARGGLNANRPPSRAPQQPMRV